MLNQMRYNPAFSGASEGLNLLGNFRGQWIGLEGAPYSGNLSADLSIPNWNSGVGLNFLIDYIGIEQHFAFQVDYAYRQKVKATFLNFGIGLGIETVSFDGSKIITPEGEYSTGGIDHNDNLLSDGLTGGIRPLLSLGFLVINDDFKFGLAVNNLTNTRLYKGVITTLGSREELISGFKNKSGRTMQLFASYDIEINRRFELSPSLQVLTNFQQLQTDVSLLFNYNEFVFAGFSARGYNKPSLDALIPIVGVKVRKNIGIFYSYEIGTNRLKQAADGTHEVSISYFLSERKLFGGGKVINNPRFL